MKIDLTSNVNEVKGIVRAVGADQFPYATARALNKSMLAAQKAQTKGMHERFTVRRATFINRATKIKPFANKNELFGIMMISPPGGAARGDILTKFEDGGIKSPTGGRHIAVPVDVRSSKNAMIPKSLRPRALFTGGMGRTAVFRKKGTNVVRRAGGVEVLKGKRRTFLVRRADGSGEIFQRTGSGRRAFRTLYTLVRDVKVGPDLQFEHTIAATVRATFAAELEQALSAALRSAR